MSDDRSDETKLHRLLREARARRDAYASEMVAPPPSEPPTESSVAKTESPETVLGPPPSVDAPIAADVVEDVEAGSGLVPVHDDLESVPFAVGPEGDAARSVADAAPTYEPLEPEPVVHHDAPANDDLDDLAEPAVEPEPTPEELAEQERDRQFRSGEWQNIYGLDMNQVASEIASRPRQVAGKDPLSSGEWEHENGAPWHEMPIPRKWHRCRPHSTKRSGDGFKVMERCPCGGVRMTEMGSRGDWEERNSRAEEIEAGRIAAGDAAQRR